MKKNNHLFYVTAIFLLGVILSFNLVSGFTLDNVRNYKSVEKELVIKNLYGLGDELIKYKLTYNTDYCLTNCRAEGYVTLNIPAKLFENVEYLNLNNFKTTSNVETKIYISDETEEIPVQIPTYKEVCKFVEDEKNGTMSVCTNEIIGYETEYEVRDKWIEYNGELLTGTYKWKIEGKKNIKDNLDWIGILDKDNIGEFKTTEWAVWQSSYNDNLEAYWNFTDKLNAVNVTKANMSENEGTPVHVTNSSCLIDGCVYFGGGQNYVVEQTPSINFSDDFTLNFWVRYTEFGPSGYMFFDRVNPDGYRYQIGTGDGIGTLYMHGGWFGSGVNYNTGDKFTLNTWKMLTITGNKANNNLTIYLNGTAVKSENLGLINGSGIVNQTFGTRYNKAYDLIGYLDESFYSSRTWSETEISDLYNAGAGMTYEIPDIIPPTFTSVPANQSIANNTGISIQFEATDETAFDTFVVNETSLFSINDSGYLTNVSVIPVGLWILNITINDTSNNLNSVLWQVNVSEYVEPVIPLIPVDSNSIYDVMNTSGAGLGIFITYLAQALPMLLIGLAFVGMIIVIGGAFAYILKKVKWR